MASHGVTACFFVLFLATFSGTALSGDDRSALSTVAVDLVKGQSIVVAAGPVSGAGSANGGGGAKAGMKAGIRGCTSACNSKLRSCLRSCDGQSECINGCRQNKNICIGRCMRN